VTKLQADDRGLIPGRGWEFPLHHHVQTSSGAHPVSYAMGASCSFPRVKWPGCENDHAPPYSTEVKNEWSFTSTPQYVFMA